MSQPDPNGPPTWYNEPPEWVKTLNQRRDPPTSQGRPPGYEAGRQDQELLTAIRSMPDQVVDALKSAIQAATPQQRAPENQQQQKAPDPPEQQQQQGNGQQTAGDRPPGHGETFADKWFAGKLFSS